MLSGSNSLSADAGIAIPVRGKSSAPFWIPCSPKPMITSCSPSKRFSRSQIGAGRMTRKDVARRSRSGRVRRRDDGEESMPRPGNLLERDRSTPTFAGAGSAPYDARDFDAGSGEPCCDAAKRSRPISSRPDPPAFVSGRIEPGHASNHYLPPSFFPTQPARRIGHPMG